MPDLINLPTAAPPRLSVIVVAYQEALLLSCLRTLAANAPRQIAFEVVVVLNGFSAAAELAVAARVAGARLVRSTVNRGLAGAGNLGRRFASGDLLLVLHDDVEIEPGCLEALVGAADAHLEAGAVGGKVLDLDGTLQSAGSILWRDGTTSAPWSGAAPSPEAFDEPRAVDYAGTAALLVRRRTWDAVGGLDERFYPAYYVDVDLAMAIRAHGQRVWYEPRARLRHHRGAGSTLAFRWFVTHRNRAAFLAKWGAALEHHEPRADEDAAAVARALARAQSAVAPPAAAGGSSTASQPETPADDAVYRRRERELQRAFAAHCAAERRAAAAAGGGGWRRFLRIPSLRRNGAR